MSTSGPGRSGGGEKDEGKNLQRQGSGRRAVSDMKSVEYWKEVEADNPELMERLGHLIAVPDTGQGSVRDWRLISSTVYKSLTENDRTIFLNHLLWDERREVAKRRVGEENVERAVIAYCKATTFQETVDITMTIPKRHRPYLRVNVYQWLKSQQIALDSRSRQVDVDTSIKEVVDKWPEAHKQMAKDMERAFKSHLWTPHPADKTEVKLLVEAWQMAYALANKEKNTSDVPQRPELQYRVDQILRFLSEDQPEQSSQAHPQSSAQVQAESSTGGQAGSSTQAQAGSSAGGQAGSSFQARAGSSPQAQAGSSPQAQAGSSAPRQEKSSTGAQAGPSSQPGKGKQWAEGLLSPEPIPEHPNVPVVIGHLQRELERSHQQARDYYTQEGLELTQRQIEERNWGSDLYRSIKEALEAEIVVIPPVPSQGPPDASYWNSLYEFLVVHWNEIELLPNEWRPPGHRQVEFATYRANKNRQSEQTAPEQELPQSSVFMGRSESGSPAPSFQGARTSRPSPFQKFSQDELNLSASELSLSDNGSGKSYRPPKKLKTQTSELQNESLAFKSSSESFSSSPSSSPASNQGSSPSQRASPSGRGRRGGSSSGAGGARRGT